MYKGLKGLLLKKAFVLLHLFCIYSINSKLYNIHDK